MLRNITDPVVRAVVLEDAKDKRNKLLGRAGGPPGRNKRMQSVHKKSAEPQRDFTVVTGAGRGSSTVAKSMVTPC